MEQTQQYYSIYLQQGGERSIAGGALLEQVKEDGIYAAFYPYIENAEDYSLSLFYEDSLPEIVQITDSAGHEIPDKYATTLEITVDEELGFFFGLLVKNPVGSDLSVADDVKFITVGEDDLDWFGFNCEVLSFTDEYLIISLTVDQIIRIASSYYHLPFDVKAFDSRAGDIILTIRIPNDITWFKD